MADESGKSLNIGALTVGVTGLVTVVGGLSLTGDAGRVIRDEPEAIGVALALVLVGAVFLAGAGLTATKGITENVLSVLGLELILGGLLVGALTAADTAGRREAPAISAKLVDFGHRLTGKVTAANMGSDGRLVVFVDGLNWGNKKFTHTPLERAYIGADGDGKVDMPIDTRIAAGRFDAVAVSGWTTEAKRSTEHDLDKPASTAGEPCGARARGCVIIPLAPVPKRPRVTASWSGKGSEADRLDVHVVAPNTPSSYYRDNGGAEQRRVALVVKGRTGSGPVRIYAAALPPAAHGRVDVTIHVPVPPGLDEVCVGAAVIAEGLPLPTIPCTAGDDINTTDGTLVELARPKPTPTPTPTPPPKAKAP
jgi:hypothetical protein